MSQHAYGGSPVEVGSRPRDGPVRRRTRLLPPALLGLAAVAATGGAVYVISVSRIAPNPPVQALLTALVCLAFVGAGVLALRLRPYARFGMLLAAVGFASLISVLHEANDAVPYTIGVFASNLVFAVLVHALLAYPSGRLGVAGRRLLVAAAYVDVLALQALAVVFDPLTRYHSDHPRNLGLIDSRASLATGIYELEAALAALIALAAVLVLTRRARAATPAARRELVPVLLGGKVALLMFSLGLALAPLSSGAGYFGFGLGLLAALALPGAFIGTLVQGRLSRSAVGELLVELGEPGEPPLLRDGLRRALGDPFLEVARVRPEDGVYLDRFGDPVTLPGPGDAQIATPLLHQGEPVGALVHDRSLRRRPELLDAVGAAASFALANERALDTVQRVEARNRALLDAIPDLMFRVARDGTYLDIHADDTSGLLLPPEELIGRSARDVLPPDVADIVLACVERALDTGSMCSCEYRLEVGGSVRWFESRMVPSGAGEVVTIVRDFTSQRKAETARQRLADEQAALRRVATLVAGNAPPDDVFQTVTEEVCRLLGLRTAVLHRFEGGNLSTIVGKYGEPTGPFEFGRVNELEIGSALQVLATGRPARSDYAGLTGGGAEELRALGFTGSVGVPITVAGVTWGALVVALREGEALPLRTERRLQAFAELVGLAVASAHARDELSASRLRIIEASDAERRRIERNLHDGAQQRLVALSVGLRVAQTKLASSPEEAKSILAQLSEDLAEAVAELRELAQGIHPAVLTERGLSTALEVLAARAPMPVDLDVRTSDALDESMEAAAYYVVSESLANVVKHAHASSVSVRVEQLEGHLLVEIADDGVGGADVERGSGLRGLRDRVETLDGILWVDSPPGRGTLVRAELPVAADKSVATAARDR
ncbi:MAG TPA: histidine kinase [Gaiellaceae bacterium]|nr:histidine kinase [Gaiellaceae bacterium]